MRGIEMNCRGCLKMLSMCRVILNVSEGSRHPNMRFFLPKGRQNDKMMVGFRPPLICQNDKHTTESS